jgi:hypothetical protein
VCGVVRLLQVKSVASDTSLELEDTHTCGVYHEMQETRGERREGWFIELKRVCWVMCR